jgi:hypothetical protein
MRELYPGYDVLAKRNTPSWNEQTRDVINRRLAIGCNDRRFFTEHEWLTLRAICDCVVPQPEDRSNFVPVAAMVDQKMREDEADGYRDARLLKMQQAWQCALAALDADTKASRGSRFHELARPDQVILLQAMERGELRSEAWGGMRSDVFFHKRLLPDVVHAYYAHPTAWSEIGWGGPAAPRGYVRMDFDRRDPWEAAEAKPGREDEAYQENRRVGR